MTVPPMHAAPVVPPSAPAAPSPAATAAELEALRAERDALRERCAALDARLAAFARLSSDGFWELDASLRFVAFSGGPAAGGDTMRRLLLGRAPWELPATVPLSGEWDDLHSLLEAGEPFDGFVCVTRALGADERFVALAGEPRGAGPGAGWHGIARDVTATHRAQERLRRLAHRDRLTGLPNRAVTESAIQQMLEDAARDGARVHLLFVDLDGFKQVNDGLGHAAGDRVLQEAAHRLRTVLRDEDVLGRFGGDEFVVALVERPGTGAGGDLAARASTRLRDAMAAPVVIDGRDCPVGASVGTASFPDDGDGLPALLQAADAAMYAAKRARRASRPVDAAIAAGPAAGSVRPRPAGAPCRPGSGAPTLDRMNPGPSSRGAS